MPSDTERASVPASISESFNEGDLAHATGSWSTDSTLFNAETSELFSQLLGLKFDQKFAAFKRDLDEKEVITQSQLKKLKTESKASSSFNFKAKKVQYRFNSSLLDAIDGAVKTISKGNLSAANSELKRVKILITKRNKLIHFAYKSLAGWTVVEGYESAELANDSEERKSSHQLRDERSLRFGRRSVEMCLAGLTLQLLLIQRSSICWIIHWQLFFSWSASFFAWSLFVVVSLKRQTSALAADREATGRILPPAQTVLEEPFQPLQAVKIKTDHK